VRKLTRAKANRKKLSESVIRNLPVRRKRQYQTWDAGTGAERGLSVLVSPAGAKSYRSTFYFPGSPKPHSRHLGRVGEISLEEARKQCGIDREKAKQGIDPRKGDSELSGTYATAVDTYIQREMIGRNQRVSAPEAKRILMTIDPSWHKQPLTSISMIKIQDRLEFIRDGDGESKSRPYAANAAWRTLMTFFRWCEKKQLVGMSPVKLIDKPFNAEKRRDRPWFRGDAADAVIKKLWKAANTLRDDGRYLKILLLTGKRKTAIAEMLWEQIDTSWFWNAPPSKTKSKRLHAIPLPSLAQRVLGRRKESGCVFLGLDGGHIDVNHDTLAKQIRDASGVADFFLHGVRHMLESKMAELRVPPHIRDLLFDHAPPRGAGSRYDHHDYRDEMTEALERWCEHVEGLVQPREGVELLR
jgi:integrase